MNCIEVFGKGTDDDALDEKLERQQRALVSDHVLFTATNYSS